MKNGIVTIARVRKKRKWFFPYKREVKNLGALRIFHISRSLSFIFFCVQKPK